MPRLVCHLCTRAAPTARRTAPENPTIAAHSSGGPRADLRFDSAEHQTYGNEGARAAGYTATYAPTPHSLVPFELTFGDIVMLSGDYFEPREEDGEIKIPNNLFELAGKPSTDLGNDVGTQEGPAVAEPLDRAYATMTARSRATSRRRR